MIPVIIESVLKDGDIMWSVDMEDYPRMAAIYTSLDVVLGLLQARARVWRRFYIVTVNEPGATARVIAYEGSKMLPVWPEAVAKAA